MSNHFTDNDDLLYYFDKGVDWAPLYEISDLDPAHPKGPQAVAEAVATYREIAETVGEFVANEIGPVAAQIDRKGVHLGEDGEAIESPEALQIFARIRDLDLHGMSLPSALGGSGCPLLLYFVTAELIARNDVSLMTHHTFHGAMALAMVQFSIKEGSAKFSPDGALLSTRFDAEITDILSGKAWGCMDITEPDAGSDMAALRTTARQDADGIWRIDGEKIFITSGHGKYHFVIARTEPIGDENDPFSGLKGLSFFLVKAYEDKDGKRVRYARLGRVEEKLGHHGSVTAAVLFENTSGSLIGKRGEGFQYMLTLMNGARLGVGFESIGLCEAAYRAAKEYAAQRRSMGKTIDRHEMIADMLLEMRTDIQGLRALAVWGAWHNELSLRLDVTLLAKPKMTDLERAATEKRRRRHARFARRGTPLLKYLAAEKAVEMARRCIQIHGGNGYMKEYPAEKLLRDSLVMPIYEGTSQIQAVMAMKDILGGIIKNPQRFVAKVAQARWRAVSARDGLERRLARVQSTSLAAQQYLVTRVATGKVRALGGQPMSDWPRSLFATWDPRKDFALPLLHAERLIRILCDELIGEVLWEQAAKHPERRDLLERWLDRAEPRTRALLDEITTTGDKLLAELAGSDTEQSSEKARA